MCFQFELSPTITQLMLSVRRAFPRTFSACSSLPQTVCLLAPLAWLVSLPASCPHFCSAALQCCSPGVSSWTARSMPLAYQRPDFYANICLHSLGLCPWIPCQQSHPLCAFRPAVCFAPEKKNIFKQVRKSPIIPRPNPGKKNGSRSC